MELGCTNYQQAKFGTDLIQFELNSNDFELIWKNCKKKRAKASPGLNSVKAGPTGSGRLLLCAHSKEKNTGPSPSAGPAKEKK